MVKTCFTQLTSLCFSLFENSDICLDISTTNGLLHKTTTTSALNTEAIIWCVFG